MPNRARKNSAEPRSGRFVCLGHWVLGDLGIWVLGYLGIWVFGYLGIWVLGYLGTWVFHFRYIAQKIRCSAFASSQSTRTSGFRLSSAVATMRRKNFVSFASFLQEPMRFLKSLRDTASSASQ